ncbi:hypothetical protein [Janthinobacterium sp. PC23-8]|uniref:hypothetical protein n=1 Tax=Janthinobacterium sp. PC23-8 TaxID=2012679 RepID=UPI000B971127|nr:hypothetical protein [Janthinobacterium sp. PC23-8]OYO31314.1 hypothetical protein CD932_09420 [Janthinobacterium sp. PC23-8]
MFAQPASTRLSPPRQRRLAMLLAIVGVAATGSAAHAEPSVALDRASISLGAFYADPRIDIGADTQFGRLDTPSSNPKHTTIPRIKADLLIGERHGLAFDYYRYDKNYTPTLSGQTIINGQPVTGTATADADLRLDLAQLAYKWWLGADKDTFGIGLGAAYYSARLDGTATGLVNGVSATARDSVSEHAFAPLLEVAWCHAFTPQVRMYLEASGIKKNGGTINGHIYGGNIGVEWFPFQNIGFVADYGISKIALRRDSSRDADLNIRLTGPSAYVKMRF